jgi:type IV fimbrial biogenesis protein FimT
LGQPQLQNFRIFKALFEFVMHYRSLKPGSTAQSKTPFICRNMPYVGLNNPVIIPIVGKKIPFVCNRGFNLVELIVTLTIAGILMAVAAPALQSFVSSNRLASQINDLIADINLSRNEAIKRNTTTGVCVTAVGGTSCETSGNWANGWLVYYVCQTGDLSGCTAGNNIVVKIHEALTGNNTLTAPGDQIVFSKSGIIASGAGQFTLTDPKANTKRIVCIAATGRPSLSQVNCT